MNGAAVKTYRKGRWGRDFKRHWLLYLMFLPTLLFFLLFCYVPMYGILMAFFDYKPALGFSGSRFVGVDQFKYFFDSIFLNRILYNTFFLNLWDVIFAFPAPIIFALILFEIKSNKIKRSVQFVTYMPFFISLVVVCGMIFDFSQPESGLFNNILAVFGAERRMYLNDPKYYFFIHIVSGVWQNLGFASIIYFAALCGISPELYDSASIDGAGKFRTIWSITLPSILPVITIMFILRMGNMFNVGFEKSYLLKTTANSSRSEVIATFVYDRGLKAGNWGYGTAVGLMNAAVNFLFLWTTNFFAKRTQTSLW